MLNGFRSIKEEPMEELILDPSDGGNEEYQTIFIKEERIEANGWEEGETHIHNTSSSSVNEGTVKGLNK